MKAARLHKYNEPLQLDEVNIPKPKGEGVIIRVGAAGITIAGVMSGIGVWTAVRKH